MFKNLTLFTCATPPHPDGDLSHAQFSECGPTQDLSIGFVPPRGHAHGALREKVGAHTLMRVMIERKAVPPSAVQRHADLRAEGIELAEGRKPGRKEMKEIREECRLSLLPQAFPKRKAIWVWFWPGFMALDCASQSDADLVVAFLLRAFKDDVMGLQRLQVVKHPRTVMAAWLAAGEASMPFWLGRDLDLDAPASDAGAASVKFRNRALDEVAPDFIVNHHTPTRVELVHGDVSFILTDAGQLRRIRLSPGLFSLTETDGDADPFDADAAIACGALEPLIRDLITALGGQQV
jgi:recombination associated protein RdgC